MTKRSMLTVRAHRDKDVVALHHGDNPVASRVNPDVAKVEDAADARR